MATNKYVCVHGHFYQPPRENAWLEFVELQDSAAPWHDWNERINFECYSTNASARILDKENYITKIVNNYERISFNMGPTLLSWLEQNDAVTYRKILEADEASLKQFGGHGTAIAQAHSHIILPLANYRDKETQVAWGVADFEHRFGRKPEGMWLAETAVDTASLEVLVDFGIKYTILAPRQMKALRYEQNGDWHYVENEQFDTRRPYKCKLPSGREIALFFYNGDISQGIAFEGLLNNGKNFASRILGAFDNNDSRQLVHIATDGESYGHHHRYGEMALADCLNSVENSGYAKLTNYGQYLELFPLDHEVQIHDNSSWSCVHGVERWRSNCGCSTGGEGHWNQAWRAPLRDALDWLRDEIMPIYEREGGKLLNDIWAARNDYISVLLDRKEETVAAFIKKNAKKELSEKDIVHLLRLMEMQRNAMLMYTSCGWFFNEISGIETNQILQYALRAIQYAQQINGVDFHPHFLELLENTPSNIHKNAAVNYREKVLPTSVGLERAGMHFAAAALFEKDPSKIELFNYEGYANVIERIEAGSQRLVIGKMTLRSKITYSKKDFSFAALYLGQQNIIGAISRNLDKEGYEEMKTDLVSAFNSANLGDVIINTEKYFEGQKFTISHLFRDEKRKILSSVIEQNLKQAENSFRDVYEDNYQLMTTTLESNTPVPDVYLDATQHVLNKNLLQFFLRENMYFRDLRHLASEFKKWKVDIKHPKQFKLAASERITTEIQNSLVEENNTGAFGRIKILNKILTTLDKMGVILDFAKSQNAYYELGQRFKKGELTFFNKEWKSAFFELGDILKVRNL